MRCSTLCPHEGFRLEGLGGRPYFAGLGRVHCECASVGWLWDKSHNFGYFPGNPLAQRPHIEGLLGFLDLKGGALES